MFKQKISEEVWGSENGGKYRLRDPKGNPVDLTPEDTCMRVAQGLAEIETSDKEYWAGKFYDLLAGSKFSGGGRITANVGAGDFKRNTSPINCVVLRQIPDSMEGIMQSAKEAAVTLKAGCGVGYDFSTIRPRGAYVFGAGAETSGVISFMKIFDATCSTVMSGGGRRGAQMGCLDIQHPEVESFITCKRENGVLRYFNLSVLITDAFMECVTGNKTWDFWFWSKTEESIEGLAGVKIIAKDDIPFRYPEYDYFTFSDDHTEVLSGNCKSSTLFKKKVFKTIPAKELFNQIMESNYQFAEPGFLLIDRVNFENNLYFAEVIRATNPCGEQPLSPDASCLLGSMILNSYVVNPFEDNCYFDFDMFSADIVTASRLLDNVVEINNLPLPNMYLQIKNKRRHGLGFTGLGTIFNMLRLPYGSKESIELADKISLIMAQQSLLANIELAKEKGPAPIFDVPQNHEGLEVLNRELVKKSGYMKRLLPTFGENQWRVEQDISVHGLRYSHATSIAPTGTLSLTWGNNCSNGIEPSFSNSYMRNIRVVGKKTKTQEEILSYEYMIWKEKYPEKEIPSWWRISDDLSVDDHINVQAAVQKWVDSAVSKTANVPTDYPFEDFKEIYIKGWKAGLKGVTTFRFNPTAFSGVLVRKEDLAETEYSFTMEDGTEITVNGSDQVEYDGELHNAANLFDALKEGMYGDM